MYFAYFLAPAAAIIIASGAPELLASAGGASSRALLSGVLHLQAPAALYSPAPLVASVHCTLVLVAFAAGAPGAALTSPTCLPPRLRPVTAPTDWLGTLANASSAGVPLGAAYRVLLGDGAHTDVGYLEAAHYVYAPGVNGYELAAARVAFNHSALALARGAQPLVALQWQESDPATGVPLELTLGTPGLQALGFGPSALLPDAYGEPTLPSGTGGLRGVGMEVRSLGALSTTGALEAALALGSPATVAAALLAAQAAAAPYTTCGIPARWGALMASVSATNSSSSSSSSGSGNGSGSSAAGGGGGGGRQCGAGGCGGAP
jgi:hypothetical protein